ncbi:MAG: BBE domain-containing protein [Pseudonocardiaceae bacterium]
MARRNLDRLIEIKKTYDPDNLFRSNRNIRAQAEGPARPVDAPTATT